MIQTIDEYIAQYPEGLQERMQAIRNTIRTATPDATEKISYKMPTFYLNGNLVHFAAFKNHIGFYPAPSAVITFYEGLKDYKTSKGAIQFPHNKPIPFDLITQIVKFRAEEQK